MSSKTLIAALLVPVMVCAALKPVTGLDTEIRIIGGGNAQKDEFPYAVSLQLSARNAHFCTGSLLEAKTVLTAGHCVTAIYEYGLGTEDVAVRVGSLVSHPLLLGDIVLMYASLQPLAESLSTYLP